jgi:capsular polysaccharide biosynthesis protein
MYDPRHDSKERTVPTDATQASATYAGVEGYFSLRDVLQIFWRRLWIVILVVLVFVGTAVGASLSQTPVYEASAKLWLGQKQSQDQVQPNLMGSVEGLQQLTHTMAVAIESRTVAEEVIQRHGLQMDPQDLLNNLTVEQIEDSSFLLLSYRDTHPERAKEIVDGVSDVSTERISEANASTSDITVTVWERAVVPDTPVSPDPVRNGLLALGLGLMLGTGLAFLLEHLDDSWRSPEEVEQVSGVPTFGVVPQFEVAKNGKTKAR